MNACAVTTWHLQFGWCRWWTTTNRSANRCPAFCGEFGFAVRAFCSAQAFLSSDVLDRTDCLILDVAMPGMSGPELQIHVARQRKIPTIFISASVDQAVTARVSAQGAAAFLHKPFSERALLDALGAALGRDDWHD